MYPSPNHRRLKIQNQNKPLWNRPCRTPRPISKRFEVPTSPSSFPTRTWSPSCSAGRVQNPPHSSHPVRDLKQYNFGENYIFHQLFANYSLFMASKLDQHYIYNLSDPHKVEAGCLCIPGPKTNKMYTFYIHTGCLKKSVTHVLFGEVSLSMIHR